MSSDAPAPQALRGKVIVVTGASSGIGEATARELIAGGATVIGAARGRAALDRVAASLGDAFVPSIVDVADDAAVAALIDDVRAQFGRLDVVVANAAIAGGGTITEGDPAEWEPMIATNVFGAGVTMHHAARVMKAQGHGHLVLISSVIGSKVPPARNHMYAATKWAVLAIAEGLRQELAGTIRVTVIEPGFVDTAMNPGDVALAPTDVARVITFAVSQPSSVALNRVQLRHVGQLL